MDAMVNSEEITGKRPELQRKGERTRRRILLAAMRVIARDGVRGTTHRAVAIEAGVQLSLTTYYFKNLGELVSEAFKLFMDRDREDLAERWVQAYQYLDRFDVNDLAKKSVRNRITNYITKRIVKHMRKNLEKSPEGLAIERHFFFEALADPELTGLANLHRQRLLEPIIRFCTYFNSKDPEVDSELLLGAVTRLEYESLLVDPSEINYRRIQSQIHRLVGWIVNSGHS